ncbi:hypothetical protein PHLGIDRAFT_365585 [Phlebiopsis gigantea 11061_1 CR5-6]|uniref:Uncharacterized protein n=1 Tax=Phlebiopsis gigantea (strain 11061_1 CR5-6) TaxID=745531 RepID=A0A0C3S9W5_PHLG1|nr:hypothetical protein PHLGIDRAFT_365585 [Phlebiopsis gigantea 11061_1 CR5-6]
MEGLSKRLSSRRPFLGSPCILCTHYSLSEEQSRARGTAYPAWQPARQSHYKHTPTDGSRENATKIPTTSTPVILSSS